MAYLYSIRKVTGTRLRDKLYASHEYRDSGIDVLQVFAGLLLDFSGDYTEATVVGNHSSFRTIVKTVPSLLDALGIFYEVVSQGGIGRERPLSNWKPRERVSLSGVTFPGLNLVSGLLSDLGHYSGSTADIPFDVFDTSLGGLISFDRLFAFFADFSADGERSFTRSDPFVNSAGIQGDYSTARYTNMRLDDFSFEYDVVLRTVQYTGRWTPSPTWVYSEVTYRGKFSRSKLEPWLITYECTQGYGTAYDGPIGALPPEVLDSTAGWHVLAAPSDWGVWQEALEVTTDVRFSFAGIGTVEIQSFYRNPFSISNCSSALFFTQSKAFSTLMGEVSRNFESLAESGDTIGSLVGVVEFLTSGESLIPDFVSANGYWQKLRLALKFVAGAYLTYSFVVAPVVKAAVDVFRTLLKRLKGVKGEASIRFHGRDLSTLPGRLRMMLESIRSETIVSYDVRFRSQAEFAVNASQLVGALDSVLAEAQKFGIEPDPTYLYKAIPFSFAFDWFVPMGGMLDAAYNRYKMIGSKGYTIGHSVRIDLVYRSGNCFHIYLRSDPTELLFDPPSDNWLTSHGAPVAIASALVATLFG